MCVRIAPLLLLLLCGVAQAQAAPPEPACSAEPVRVGRFWSEWTVEEASLRLTHCDGSPNEAALHALSILARPRGVNPPDAETLQAFAGHPRLVAPGIPRLHPGLLVRLAAVAERFPGRRIEIVSGYRPKARPTSRHRHARALDIRVDGVSRTHLSEFLRTLPETGVGYYPNSTFTHVDVRERSAYWVDRSGPGEPADYGPPPEPARAVEEERREVVAGAMSALEELALPAGEAAPPEVPEDSPLSPDEIRELRRTTLAAIDALGRLEAALVGGP